MYGGIVENSFYLDSSCSKGYSYIYGSAKTEITSKTSTQLKALAPQLGSDFKSVPGGYPILAWE